MLPLTLCSYLSVCHVSATETSIRLYDVNNDGIEDVIFGYSRVMEKLNEDGMKSFCESISEYCVIAI